ncbi:hypothetical protein COW20_15210 [bacterium (Candidatus Blackallbacteria) CG13_big_fil_rev_8_21_14_2_50_49_14]|nr:MAG: hypothetical protein COW64_15050 [bacterium (Candidatus Blackallbacteria) CG18_big_fil_WC_8_21_14_2_50_49_26]PIW46636.1 MAG: hypothetical protein COW20_15210 [bacterium (Candidatus Blackallbacteria) CG13_big_fil_rev_8_21_14_2_50_49_14]
MPDIEQRLFPDEVTELVYHFQRQTGNYNIEAFLSFTNPNLWLIGQEIEGVGIHVIAQYEKFDLQLNVIKGEDFF